jgi:hypothetical protein
MKTMVQRYPDRVSISFSEDAGDVDCIVTVTFDMRVITGLGDEAIVDKAKERLKAFR